MGIGLAALGFWLFLTVVAASVAWNNVQKARLRHDTIQKLLESGQPLDQQLVDRLLNAPPRPPRFRPHAPDPRDPFRSAGVVFFWAGFVTAAIGVQQDDPVALFGLLALGLFAMFLAFRVWADGERQFKEGLLTRDEPGNAE